MTTFFLVSTQKTSEKFGILKWRPALSNGTPTGESGDSMSVFHGQDIPTPLKRYVVWIGNNCELYPAKRGPGPDGGMIWEKDGSTPKVKGDEVLVQYD